MALPIAIRARACRSNVPDWLCRRPFAYAFQSYGRALSGRAYASGGQYLHGSMYGRHSVQPERCIPEANYGDVMIIIGRDGDAEITMDEMARLRGTINYEVACGFGMRLDKVYV